MAEENRRLRMELEVKDLINHSLSEMYMSSDVHFQCDVGYDDVPTTILDSKGDVLFVSPNNSSYNALLCLYLCSFLNNVYKNFEDEIINDAFSIQELIYDMGV